MEPEIVPQPKNQIVYNQPAHSAKKYLIFIIAVLLLLVIFSFVVFSRQSKTPSQNVPNPQPSITATSAVSTVLPTVTLTISITVAPTDITSNQATESSYLACGCGCCQGATPVKKCIYKSKGETLEQVKQADLADRQNSSCALMGCAIGTEYTYCD